MNGWKKFGATMFASALLFASMPAEASETDTPPSQKTIIYNDPVAGNPVEISNIKVSNITENSADISFDYRLNENKMWYKTDNGEQAAVSVDAKKQDIEKICFIVNVEQVLDITLGTRFPGFGSHYYDGEYTDDLCTNIDGVDDIDYETMTESQVYSLKSNRPIFHMETIGTFNSYSFYRYHSLEADDITNRGSMTITIEGLRPNTFYGNRNLPKGGPDYQVQGDLYKNNFATFDPFYAQCRECTALSNFFAPGTPYWAARSKAKLDNEWNILNAGQHFSINSDLLFIGAQVTYKDGTHIVPTLYNATHVPDFTTKATDQLVFADVSKDTPHVDDIRWLVDREISTGWKEADGSSTFRGMSPVVRQDMAAFLRREAKNRGVADAASWQPSAADWKRFKDVDRNTPHAEDILWLAHAGISTGWKEADGTSTFRGMSPVVRQDMAAFLKRLAAKAGKDGGVKPKTDFSDVTAATPHRAEIQWLGGSGISQGYRNNDGSWRFEGMTRVYRQDMAAFIHRLDTHISK